MSGNRFLPLPLGLEDKTFSLEEENEEKKASGSAHKQVPFSPSSSTNISAQPKNLEKKKKKKNKRNKKAFGSKVPASLSHPKESEEDLRTMAFSPSTSTNISEKKKNKKKASRSTHKQVPASSSHPKESEEELRTMAFSPSTSTNISEKKKNKKKASRSTHKQVPASSSHPKESEEELRTVASSPSSLTIWDQALRDYEAPESLPLKDKHIRAAHAEIDIVYVPMLTGVAKDMEVEKGERSVFICVIKSRTRHWCDLYRFDQTMKKCSKSFGRIEWGESTRFFGITTVGSTIYILGGLHPDSFFVRSQPDSNFSNDVFYFDVHCPCDGWKAGPQLPSTHFDPVATSMNGTIYIFNGKYIFARALDTRDSKPSWKTLQESPSPFHFVMAFPDPKRDRILLYSVNGGFFAYHPRNGEMECISSELRMHPNQITTASVLVDGVLYHNEYCSDKLLCAYDLDQRKKLTTVCSSDVDIDPNDYMCDDWDSLLDLGGGKLCLVRITRVLGEAIYFLKLKVEKEPHDVVRITVVSFDMFKLVDDYSYVRHFVAL